jgi:hypothetical protein
MVRNNSKPPTNPRLMRADSLQIPQWQTKSRREKCSEMRLLRLAWR